MIALRSGTSGRLSLQIALRVFSSLQLTGQPSGRLRLWRDGYRYSKAGVMTFDLTAASLKDVGLTDVIQAAIDEYVHQGG